ncbi:hypothetical protein [Pedobacter frigiditerrae]|uniref:hypothetical protein n=1 Tax=Pedobacter frigiditerrae TaxID=2530452 RepID=UPI00292F5418|nr:hypothetical protein [Pedobacter frigiditerrae]
MEDIIEHQTKTGEFPDFINTYFGIEYYRMDDNKSFTISYNRGFLVKEKYHSNYKKWISYGWND